MARSLANSTTEAGVTFIVWRATSSPSFADGSTPRKRGDARIVACGGFDDA
jgi:hypothetical protein